MKRIVAVLIGAGLLSLTGCPWSPGTGGFVANDATQGQQFFDEGKVAGKRNTVTVQKGSRLTKFSVAGDDNMITFDDGVPVPKIEVWGNNNTFSIPEDTVVQFAQIGHNNQLVRRPAPQHVRERIPGTFDATGDRAFEDRPAPPPPPPPVIPPPVTPPPPVDDGTQK
jgi:hypothetical protein